MNMSSLDMASHDILDEGSPQKVRRAWNPARRLALLVVCSAGRLMSKQTLQLFELHVLLAMLQEGAETYSVPLVLALERRTERSVAQAAVFIALKRLERKGLVSSRLEEPHDGRTRRYFKLTRQGLAAIEATRLEHLRLWQGSRRLLGIRKA